MSNHTPTPYYAFIHQQKSGTDAQSHGQVVGPPRVLLDHDWAFTPEDAEFIVRACNAHDDLVEACRKAMTCSASMNSDVVALIQAALANAKPDISPEPP